MEASEAEFRWIIRETDGKYAEEDLEKEWEEMSCNSRTGKRLVKLDVGRDGPIDHRVQGIIEGELWTMIVMGRLIIHRIQPTSSRLNLWQARRAPT